MKKIIVDKKAKQKLIDRIANKIIDIGRRRASEGMTGFTYCKIGVEKGDRLFLLGIDYSAIIRLVEHKTDNTITCVERGHSDYSIKFRIGE